MDPCVDCSSFKKTCYLCQRCDKFFCNVHFEKHHKTFVCATCHETQCAGLLAEEDLCICCALSQLTLAKPVIHYTFSY